MVKKQTTALVLLSGGLDSILAVKLLQEQGIKVIGINFYSEFFGNTKAIEAAEQLRIPFVSIKLGKKYIKMIKNPKYGYGSAMNPCIDCRIFMLKIAKKLMRKFHADFIATGEVLGERQMSQYRGAMINAEKEAGLSRMILRPLSAKLLEETIPEEKGLVDRNKLLDIQGRRRKIQLEMAKKYNLKFPSPGGGCLLCEKEFAKKLSDLFEHNEINEEDIKLLKLGRHFRYKNKKIIIGRNEIENKELIKFKGIKMMPSNNIPGPITLLRINSIFPKKEIIRKAAELTAFYSDLKEPMSIIYGKRRFNKQIFVILPSKEEVEQIRV
ncbi:MAG: tRNA 4-thiouridine(8) synthase ThiI [Candidatus Pacearchaeota archaeon]